MPIFIDELVFRGEIVSAPPGAPAADTASAGLADAADREAMVAEVTAAVIDHLERALERVGER